MNIKQKLNGFLRTVFPENRQESAVFAFFLVSYGFFASFIALNYRIVFDDRIPWDAYFSFDNRSIVMTGGGFERHPLSNYFFDIIRKTALAISGGKKDEIFRLVLSLLSVLAISFSNLQIFKYLRNIIRLPLWISWCILFFFGVFSTNILLSFTPETYTYTLFLLSFFTYYSALKLRNGQKLPASALALATVSVGGLTVTNAVKVFLPVFFEKGIFQSSKKIINALFRSALAVLIFILLYLNRLNFDAVRIFSKTGEQYEKFSKPKVTPLWDMIASWFFGGNVLFSGFVIRDYHNKKGFQYKALFMDVYTSWIPYAAVGLLLLFLAISFFRNRKNPLVIILSLSFLVDIIIHCLLKFGLHTSYIYGGHFVFVYPLMLGWLFFSLKENPRILSVIFGGFILILVYVLVSNFYRLSEFVNFLNRYYQ